MRYRVPIDYKIIGTGTVEVEAHSEKHARQRARAITDPGELQRRDDISMEDVWDVQYRDVEKVE